MVEKEEITVAEAGRRGGRATLESQGIDFFKRIGKKGGERTAELYKELLSEFGRKGGRPRRLALDEYMEGED
jgi:general stress protein YciG